MVHELHALAEFDRDAAGLEGRCRFFAGSTGGVVVKENLDVGAAVVGPDESFDKFGVREGEHGAGDRVLSTVDMVKELGESRRVGQKEQFKARIGESSSGCVGEKVGERWVIKAEGEIVMEKEGGGGEVSRAEEDEGFIDDDDFAVHEATAFFSTRGDGGWKGKRAGFGIDGDGDGDALEGFLVEFFDEFGVGDSIDSDMDTMAGLFNGAQEG